MTLVSSLCRAVARERAHPSQGASRNVEELAAEVVRRLTGPTASEMGVDLLLSSVTDHIGIDIDDAEALPREIRGALQEGRSILLVSYPGACWFATEFDGHPVDELNEIAFRGWNAPFPLDDTSGEYAAWVLDPVSRTLDPVAGPPCRTAIRL